MQSDLSNHIIKIPQLGSVNLSIDHTPEKISDLFLMAARANNKKRSFLFVSKVLGKHIPISPKTLFDKCNELSLIYAATKNLLQNERSKFEVWDQTLIIGLAEAATAMGHCVYDNFDGECHYVHSTRSRITNYDFAFDFQEEHSHQTEQFIYLRSEDWIKNAREIIIVDDEVTTGKTIKNLILNIEKKYPGKKYSILTFLDWRCQSKQDNSLQVSDNINVAFHSLVKGNINSMEINSMESPSSTIKSKYINNLSKYLNNLSKHINNLLYNPLKNGWHIHRLQLNTDTITSARSGINTSQRSKINRIIDKLVRLISPYLKEDQRNIIGTREFMYIPLLLAKSLPGKNYFHATTRTPIITVDHLEYGTRNRLEFTCPEDATSNDYLYNLLHNKQKEIILVFENEFPLEMAGELLRKIDKNLFSSKHLIFVKS